MALVAVTGSQVLTGAPLLPTCPVPTRMSYGFPFSRLLSNTLPFEVMAT